MLKRILSLALALTFVIIVAAYGEEKDYSYLEDMTVKELRELRDEINKILGDDDVRETDAGKDRGTTIFSFFGNEEEPLPEGELPTDDLEYKDWRFHYAKYKIIGDIIIIFFDCTNNTNRADTVHMTINNAAYQDGIALQPPATYSLNLEGAYDKMLAPAIQPGKTIQVAFVYKLNNPNSDVTFELQNWGISQARLRKVLEIR